MLDAMTGAPAFVRNGRMDILAANRLGLALYSEHVRQPASARRTPRGSSSSTRARPSFYVDWERVANDAVAILRAEAGRDPYDRDLSDLVGELSTQSELFRTRWAAHDVRYHDTGVKRFHHPVVGDLDLTFETMTISRRRRADDVRLHRRARLEVGGGAEPARQLGGDARPSGAEPGEPERPAHAVQHSTRRHDVQITRSSLETGRGRATGSPARSTSTRSQRRRAHRA